MVVPISIAVATHDFNAKDQDSEAAQSGEFNFMSFIKDDLILITSRPNEAGWFEGYQARDQSCKLGISHTDFIKIMF